jgi:hypothetical protein
VNNEALKVQILGKIADLVADFLWYDRKEDDELPRGVIEEAVFDEVITVSELVDEFTLQLMRRLGSFAQGDDEGPESG